MNIYNNTKILNSRSTLKRISDLNIIEEYSNKDIQFFTIYNYSGIFVEYTSEDYDRIKQKKRLYNESTSSIELLNNSLFNSTISRLPKPFNNNINQSIGLIQSRPDNRQILTLNNAKLNLFQKRLHQRLRDGSRYIYGILKLPFMIYKPAPRKILIKNKYNIKKTNSNNNKIAYIKQSYKKEYTQGIRELSIARYTERTTIRDEKKRLKRKKIRGYYRYYLIRGNNYRRIWKRMYYKIIRGHKKKLRNYYSILRSNHMSMWNIIINKYHLYEYPTNKH